MFRETYHVHPWEEVPRHSLNEILTSFDESEEPDVSGVLLVRSHVPLARQTWWQKVRLCFGPLRHERVTVVDIHEALHNLLQRKAWRQGRVHTPPKK